MTTLLAFAFVLGVLVFVHELGHYWMAKRLGVRVLKFSLGFGPRIVGFTRGGTEYLLSAIPLGGYVKMAGENPEDRPSGNPDEFLSKSKWHRFLILFMGPAMNLGLAVLLLAVVLMQGADVPAFLDRPVVVGAVEPNSPAAGVGLRRGDRILLVGDYEVRDWEEFSLRIGTRANRPVPLTILRDGREQTITVTPEPQTQFEIGDIGVLPDVHPRVRSVTPNEPADRAGIRPGDVVLAVNDEPIVFARQLSDVIGQNPERPITITVRRDGEVRQVPVTPVRRGELGLIGVGINDEVTQIDPGPLDALRLSIEKNYETSVLIFQTVWGLITRETSPKQLMGPVAIAQLSGESAQAGWVALFALMASISLNLGLLNLLPIPVLDGGHIFIMALEGISRRDFSMRVKERLFMAGFLLLMVLMVTVIYNDLTRVRWIENLMFWR